MAIAVAEVVIAVAEVMEDPRSLGHRPLAKLGEAEYPPVVMEDPSSLGHQPLAKLVEAEYPSVMMEDPSHLCRRP
jgi:hypothetical protein